MCVSEINMYIQHLKVKNSCSVPYLTCVAAALPGVQVRADLLGKRDLWVHIALGEGAN